MITIKLKTVKGIEFDALLPNSYDMLTCKQYIDLLNIDINNKPLALEALTGVDTELWKQVASDKMELIEKELDFLNYKYDFFNPTLKNKVTINDKTIEIPKAIENKTWGQKLLVEAKLNELREVIKEKPNNVYKIYPFVTAVYLCDAYYEKDFTDELAEEFEQLLLEQPVSDVFTIAGFFLLNWKSGRKLNRSNYNFLLKTNNEELDLTGLTNLVAFQLLIA